MSGLTRRCEDIVSKSSEERKMIMYPLNYSVVLWRTKKRRYGKKESRNIHAVVKHIQRLCNYHMHGAGEDLQEIMRQSGLRSIRCLEKIPTFVVRGLKFNSWLNQLKPCRKHLMSLSPTFLIFRNRFNINACSLYLMKFHKHWLTWTLG